MKFFTSLLLVTFALFITENSFAQASVGNRDFEDILKMEISFKKGFTTYQKAIFQTESQANIIIDFQEIPINLKSIKVLDEDAHIVFSEDVQSLPVDALYELDLSKFTPGSYTIQLDSYKSSFFIDLPVK